jgi:tricorn protease
MRKPTAVASAVAVVLCAALLPSWSSTRLLRFPDIHDGAIVFCYAGDLWTASSTGGRATRLTTHPGQELFPKFSPDGRWIAFTAQYDGDEQVYVMPATGGVPRQLTYYPARGPLPPRWGYDNQVYGWTPDGSSVLFRSMREGWSLTDTRLFTVPADGGLPVALPMPVSGAGDFSPDASKLVYSPLVRDFRTWKRYQGGWAQNLYIFDLETLEQKQITDDPRTERDPMWIGEKIYFASDRSGTLNIYEYDPTTSSLSQLTESTTWDVRWPSAGPGGTIVFELGGELSVLDTATGQSRAVSITVPTDALPTRPEFISVADRIEQFELSPKGERALFVARGDVFSAPIEHGPTRNLTGSSGAHDKWARWSPDGSRIVFISDMDGEEELYLVPGDGSAQPEQLTDGGTAMRYAPEWSPDGTRIAFSDKEGRLHVLTLADRGLELVADEPRGQLLDYVWSPDSKHIAFSMTDPSGFSSIYIWTRGATDPRRVTGPDFNEFGPAWAPSGDYLYYLSDREFAPQIASFEWNYAGDRETSIYALALRKDVSHPFPPRIDEVTLGPDDEEEDAKKNETSGKDDVPDVRIDFENLGDRVTRFPIEADNYSALAAVEGHVLYVRGGPFYYGRPSDIKPSLQVFSLEKREAKTLAEAIGGYALARDGSKVLVRHEDGFKLYDTKPEQGEPKAVSTAGLRMQLDPVAEWRQIFDEVWRRFRDFFYVKNMHGYDWEALREQYRPWLDHLGHRSDLNYVIGEMIAELNVGHAYKAGGDYEMPARPAVALLGALLELDPEAGRYRIARLLPGHNEEPRYRSPLTEVGVNVSEGDYLLAIDGETLTADVNPYRVLRHKGSQPVTLTVGETPEPGEARDVTVEPVTSEASLHYLDMVLTRRAMVDEMTGGRVAYLHVPNMSADGIYEFIKWFYGQVRKEGLVVDVRSNGGGNVSQMLIERLRRELLAVGFPRTSDTPNTYPATVFHGPMVCILDENSASDGDIFPAMFREAGLGPLIGKRSWGGVIGITDRGTLIDGGQVFVPEFGFGSADGEWIIEGTGVTPDIEVDQTARDVIEGRDPQLERAVSEVLSLMEARPMDLPDRPADPVRTN